MDIQLFPYQICSQKHDLESLPDVEVVEIESDEDAAHSEEINELSQEYIMISSDEDLMELDNNGARPLKRKRRVH